MCASPLPERKRGKSGPASPCCSDKCRRARETQCAAHQRALDPERHREHCRKHYAANIERMRARNRARVQQMKEYSRRSYERNKAVVAERSRQRVLSGAMSEAKARWLSRHRDQERNRCRAKQMQRRALMLSGSSNHVDPLLIFTRANGVCGICLKPIDSSDKWHVDHVVPLSKGGVHSYANTQPAHAFCNMSKGSKWPFQRTG